MILNSILALALARPLAHAGLALASAAAGTANAVALVWLLRRRLPPESNGAVRRGWTRIVAGSVAFTAVLAAAVWWWPSPPGRGPEAAWLVAMIVGAVCFYSGIHGLLGTDEARLGWSLIHRRWRRWTGRLR